MGRILGKDAIPYFLSWVGGATRTVRPRGYPFALDVRGANLLPIVGDGNVTGVLANADDAQGSTQSAAIAAVHP